MTRKQLQIANGLWDKVEKYTELATQVSSISPNIKDIEIIYPKSRAKRIKITSDFAGTALAVIMFTASRIAEDLKAAQKAFDEYLSYPVDKNEKKKPKQEEN